MSAENSLVSICIAVYNSEEFIIETLESIKAQTYQNIELIISDDYSSDDTIALCENWVKENGQRFVNVTILETDHNTGVSANVNRAIKACKGEWHKILGADDKLTQTCIADYMSFVEKHPEAELIFGRVDFFGDMEKAVRVESNQHYGYFYLNSREQYLRLLLGMQFPSPAEFAKKTVIEKVGGFDESIPMIEDWPFWLKVMKLGIKTYFLNKVTVHYRLRESLSLAKDPSPRFVESQKLVKEYVYGLQMQENWICRIYFNGIVKMKQSGIIGMLAMVVHLVNPYTWYLNYLYRKVCRYDQKLNVEFKQSQR